MVAVRTTAAVAAQPASAPPAESSASPLQPVVARGPVAVQGKIPQRAAESSENHLPSRALAEGFEEMMVHRVMQRVDVMLEQRLRDAIALVVQEQTRSVLPRLREEIESVVRHSVYEAVADELASGSHASESR
jgi:hypothetical protein